MGERPRDALLQRLDLAQIDLRLGHDAVARVPFPLPLEPNTVWEQGPGAALWLGPDEWLITDSDDPGRDLVTDLSQALAGVHHSVIDVGANRLAFEMEVPERRDILSVGCPIDLHPAEWKAGMCAQTLIGRVPVLLHERSDSTRLFVRPSYADSLTTWLGEAASQLVLSR